jgi:hypothetical protein
MAWLWERWQGRVLVAVVVAIVIAAANGAFSGSSVDNTSDAPQGCAILASGQKLCGSDLAAYCREFDRGSLDQGTVEACAAVGVDVVRP